MSHYGESYAADEEKRERRHHARMVARLELGEESAWEVLEIYD
jgi:hypothetical protein